MTKNQKKLYDYINRYMSKKGIAPNFDEMIVFMKLSPKSKSSIHRYLTELEKEQMITRIPAKERGIKINEQ
jgi:SOS-response transcriptional repressor LexA|tara:strand:+ start:315 stop:527 length:213 start_codon:yes stop_codon:yes gene_type:complete